MSKRTRVPNPPLYFNYHDFPDALSGYTGYLLSYVSQMAHMRVDESLAALEIDVRQFGVLILVGETEHRSQIAISQNMGLDRTHVVRLVDSLEALTYLTREPNPTDRRYYKLTLTALGERTLSKAKQLVDDAQDDVYRELSTEERGELHKLLNKVATTRFSSNHKTPEDE
ncbi:MAG: MarR family transcriptional regulator [Deinococcota bacterium]